MADEDPPTLDELGINARDIITGRKLRAALAAIMQHVRAIAARTADIQFGDIVGIGADGKTLAVRFGPDRDPTSTVQNCRYIDLPAAKVPVVGDRVAVVMDNNRAVVIGRLA